MATNKMVLRKQPQTEAGPLEKEPRAANELCDQATAINFYYKPVADASGSVAMSVHQQPAFGYQSKSLVYASIVIRRGVETAGIHQSRCYSRGAKYSPNRLPNVRW